MTHLIFYVSLPRVIEADIHTNFGIKEIGLFAAVESTTCCRTSAFLIVDLYCAHAANDRFPPFLSIVTFLT